YTTHGNSCHFYVRERLLFFFFSSRRRHTRFSRDWSSDVCSSDLGKYAPARATRGTPTCPRPHLGPAWGCLTMCGFSRLAECTLWTSTRSKHRPSKRAIVAAPPCHTPKSSPPPSATSTTQRQAAGTRLSPSWQTTCDSSFQASSSHPSRRCATD